MIKGDIRVDNYGQRPLEEFVDDFCIASFNNDRKYYKNLLSIAEKVWNEINRRVVPTIMNKRIPVDFVTNTAQQPADCLILRGVSIVDHCATIQPLTYDPTRYVTPITESKGCGCKECNCASDLCCYVNSELRIVYEDVEIDGVTYQKTIKTESAANGDIVEESTEPFVKLVNDLPEIVYRTQQRVITSVDTNPCGCVKATRPNRDKIYEHCGCPVVCCDPVALPTFGNRNGHYKVEDGIIYLFDTGVSHVVVSYIGSSKQCRQIMIPEYCEAAMLAGIFYRSIQFRPAAAGYYDRRQAGIDYEREKLELYTFVNPLIVEDFIAGQHIPYKF